MIRVGITGQSGFIGTYLYNTLGLFPDNYLRIDFQDSFFQNEERLIAFVSECDVIVHLAALNRHADPDVIYNINIDLIKSLLTACNKCSSKPYILFSSSTQEERNNHYGKSKRDGRKMFVDWAEKNESKFTGLIIPNVFGPFGKPYYNSVVATFCYQLTHNEIPSIEKDSELNLIYVGDLVYEIIRKIDTVNSNSTEIETTEIPYTNKITVSDLLHRIGNFKKLYFENGIIPDLNDKFGLQLFSTFLTYIDHKDFFPFSLKIYSDSRGSFVETIKLNSGGQVSFSTTLPGVTRGNHFHTRKAERFAVIKGRALIQLRQIRTDRVLKFELDGKSPSFVDMPIWYTHNITNIGNENLYTIFWTNELFDQSDPDTFFEKV